MDAAIVANPAARADHAVRADLRAFADVRVFADHRVRPDARSRGDFRQRRDRSLSDESPSAMMRPPAGTRRLSRRLPWRFRTRNTVLPVQASPSGRNHAHRGGSGGSHRVLRGVHVNQIVRMRRAPARPHPSTQSSRRLRRLAPIASPVPLPFFIVLPPKSDPTDFLLAAAYLSPSFRAKRGICFFPPFDGPAD